MTGTVTVLGSANADLIVEVQRLPSPGETVVGGDPCNALGGKGLNQAIAAARQGVTTTFVGTVGNDVAGAEIRGLLTAERIHSDMLQTTSRPTGSAVVLRDRDGENCIVVSAGANGCTTPEVGEAAIRAAKPDDILLLQLEIPMRTVVAAALRWPGVVVLNAAPAQSVPEELWQAVDVLVVNETELDWYTTVFEGDITSSMDRLSARSVVTTMGGRGCAVRDTNGNHTHIACPDVNAIDTTGAGDAFCGVLAAGIAAGATLASAATRANIAAALSTRHLGGQTCPDNSELNSYQSKL